MSFYKEPKLYITIATCILAGLYLNFIATFPLDIISITILSWLIIASLSYLHLSQKSNSKEYSAWQYHVAAIFGILIILGLVNEWSVHVARLFNVNINIAIFITAFAGMAFFIMFMKSAQEFSQINVTNKPAMAFAAICNMAFWIILLNYYHTLPFYVHIALGLLALISAGYLGWQEQTLANKESLKNNNHDKQKSKMQAALKKSFVFTAMAAHFVAEGCIAAAQAIFKVPVALLSIVSEAVLDAPALMNHAHNDDSNHAHKHQKNKVYLFLAFCYGFVVAVLGYFEIPKAFKALNIKLSHTAQMAVVISVIVLGGLACALLNYNMISEGEHDHDLSLTTIGRNIFTPKGFLALFGAVLTSVVGVTISRDIFKLPTWLFSSMVILAFFVELSFYICNLPKLSSSVHSHKSDNPGVKQAVSVNQVSGEKGDSTSPPHTHQNNNAK